MSWVRLDDEFPDHKKVAGLSNDAFCLHVTAMCWVAKQQTDGKLPGNVLKRLAWRCQDPAIAAAELVTANVWEVTPGGWEIHDFSEYNPTKEQVTELAAKRSEAGKAGAMAKWQNYSKPDGKAHGKPIANSMPPSPSPSPSEYVTSTEKDRVGVSATPPPKKASRTVEPGSQPDMFGAIVEACQVDGKLKQGQIAKQSKLLLEAGYTPEQVRAFPEWWKSHDWRGQRGEIPTMPQLAEKIKQSVGTNGSDPSKAKRKMTIVNPFTDERTEVEG
jgi:hypothetical protein